MRGLSRMVCSRFKNLWDSGGGCKSDAKCPAGSIWVPSVWLENKNYQCSFMFAMEEWSTGGDDDGG